MTAAFLTPTGEESPVNGNALAAFRSLFGPFAPVGTLWERVLLSGYPSLIQRLSDAAAAADLENAALLRLAGGTLIEYEATLTEAHAAWSRIDRDGNQLADRQALDAALDPRRWRP